MDSIKQIFQTNSKWRWNITKWTTRLILFSLISMIPLVLITISKGIVPGLPLLTGDDNLLHRISKPVIPAAINQKQLKKYKGFKEFLKVKQQNERLANKKPSITNEQIRAAFYVDWDPQAFYSLQKNIGKLNMVVPEWFFIDPVADTLKIQVDTAALDLMKKSGVKILPLINNVNLQRKNGDFDGNLLHRVLRDNEKKELLIDAIAKNIKQYGLQGINVDFEEIMEKDAKLFVAFQKELYQKLHSQGLLVSQDMMPDDEVKELAPYNDYIFLMAYDEHYSTSIPGAVSSQRWIEKTLDETAKDVPSKKIILCMAAYGYDWPEGDEATTLTYQQALATAKQYKTTIKFNNDTYNSEYNYTDADGTVHQVYFTDAVTNFNVTRFADEYGTAGTSLWRLGSEDERFWTFYNRSLTDESLKKHPFDFSLLKNVQTIVNKPDYIGEGEILNVITGPQAGKIHIEVDTTEGVIAEEQYVQLPTKYVIQKYGKVHNQVILTFDDGPDPNYTPQVLDILKKEKVPASFFIVGIQAENNLPLLKRIYREGHEIGNHTFTHPNIATVSTDRAGTEMEATRLLIEAVTGRSTVLFRAPYNADAEPTKEEELKPVFLSKQKNYYTVGESIDPEDWDEGVTADTVYNRVVRQYERNPEKGIILLHDAGGDRQATVDALPRIIHYFKQHGVQFTTVASLLHTSKDAVMPPVQSSLLDLDGGVASFGYGLERFMTAAFWIAIVLGFMRIGIMGLMAMIQSVKKNRSGSKNPPLTLPPVSIIVPAYNEEINAVKTIENLLQQNYPSFDIIFIDDGSKDNTYQKVKAAFEGNKKVTVLTKANGGKASALNYGIDQTLNDFVICIDADTQLEKNAVRLLMQKMLSSDNNKTIGAVAGNVKVGNQNTLLTKWQSIEYTISQNFDRRALDLINGITVVPGAIGAFRKEAIEKAGGFTPDTLAEDCDLTIRIIRNGYTVVNCAEAIAVTEAPETLRQFMKQRFRWCYGIMQAFWKNKNACFHPKYGGLGMVSLPNILLFQILLPLFAPLADMMLLLSLVWNRHNPESLDKIATYYLVFLAVDFLVGIMAFAFEKEKITKLIWVLPQRFVYRQLMYVVLFRALKRAIRGETQDWGVLKRTGNVKQVMALSTQISTAN
jgi:poly-beta-1,6 N-acetyl-D-glucosamine synthase